MNTNSSRAWSGAILLLGIAILSIELAFAQAPKATLETTPASVKNVAIHYKPPVSSASIGGTPGSTRGGGNGMPRLMVLAPEHEALTTQAQPGLFWFQSAAAKTDFELTLIDPKKPQPLLTMKGSGDQAAGIHSISLARNNVTLEPGLSYRWSVALIPDPKSRSKDVIATGQIKRIDPPGDLAAKLGKATPVEQAQIYAESGFWYDALQALSIAIAAEPDNSSLHQMRASLLEQGKLTEAAAADQQFKR